MTERLRAEYSAVPIYLDEDTAEFAGGPPPAPCIPRPGKYGVAGLEEPARRLAPEALVRAGDQGNGHGSRQAAHSSADFEGGGHDTGSGFAAGSWLIRWAGTAILRAGRFQSTESRASATMAGWVSIVM